MMKRIAPVLTALALLVVAPAAWAATPEDAIDDLATQGYYIEPGSVPISESGLSDLIQSARNAGSRFMVAILITERVSKLIVCRISANRDGSASVFVAVRQKAGWECDIWRRHVSSFFLHSRICLDWVLELRWL